MVQHDCKNSTNVEPPWGQAPLASHFQRFSSARETVFGFPVERESVFSGSEGSWLIGQKSMPPVPDWSIFMQIRIPNPQFNWYKRHCLDWPKYSCSDWLVLHSSNWMGKAEVLLVEIGFQELFYKDWLSWQKHTAGRQFSTSFSLKCSLCERPPAEMAARLFKI